MSSWPRGLPQQRDMTCIPINLLKNCVWLSNYIHLRDTLGENLLLLKALTTTHTQHIQRHHTVDKMPMYWLPDGWLRLTINVMTKCCSTFATHRLLMAAGSIIDALSFEFTCINYFNCTVKNNHLCSTNWLQETIPPPRLTSCSPPVGGSIPSLEPHQCDTSEAAIMPLMWGFFRSLCVEWSLVTSSPGTTPS